jgi:hypothetical protein
MNLVRQSNKGSESVARALPVVARFAGVRYSALLCGQRDFEQSGNRGVRLR